MNNIGDKKRAASSGSDPVPVRGPLTDRELRRFPVSVSVDASNGRIPVDTAASLTSFGQQSVAEERCVIWSSFTAVIPDRLWTTPVTGTGSVSIDSGRALLSAGVNGTAQLRSRRAVRYLPGQGVVMRCTAPMPAITGSGVVYIGLGDLTNGLGFYRDSSDVGVWVANSGVVTYTPRSQWSEDAADNSGALPDVDFSLGIPLSIKFQWLGYGAIFFDIATPSGAWVRAHVIENANTSALTWTRNPSFEAFVYAVNTGGSGDAVIYAPSIGVYTEGFSELVGVARASDNVLSISAAGGVFVPVLSIRNVATLNGVSNRSRIVLTDMSVTNEGTTQALRVLLVRQPTLTGASFLQLATNQSLAEEDVTATAATYTQANIIRAIGVNPGGTANVDLSRIGFQLPPGDVVSILVARTAGGAASVANACLGWVELL